MQQNPTQREHDKCKLKGIKGVGREGGEHTGIPNNIGNAVDFRLADGFILGLHIDFGICLIYIIFNGGGGEKNRGRDLTKGC